MIQMTVEQALAVQAKQIAHYEPRYPGLGLFVLAENTHLEALDFGVDYDVAVINRHIPRGGKIEQIIANRY
jgi:hypothetical protein